MNNTFRIEEHSTLDKSFEILAPDHMEITLIIDYDDVDHDDVNLQTEAIVDILNNYTDVFKSI